MYGETEREISTEAAIVALRDACPGCGERRMDWLEWTPENPDADVRCATCHRRYTPPSAR